ncbi:MAG: hypothetical protein ACYC5H_06385 [Methylovirgula sp.]
MWEAGVAELARRTNGRSRESGAFLLGRDGGGPKKILEFVFYDDIDPHALDSGIVHFAGNRLPILWEHCRKRGYGVVADVHVHPAGYGQSASDQADPVMPRAGHIAFIIPFFASREISPGGIGMYEYLGDGEWTNHTKEGSGFFRLTVQA